MMAHHGAATVDVPVGDRDRLRSVLRDLAGRYESADHPEFLEVAPGFGHLLPPTVLDRLRGMRYRETDAALVVSGCPVDENPGPTPTHWSDRGPAATLLYDIWLVLLATQFGDPICWSSLQGGRLLNDIVPIKGHEDQQTGHGSESELEFHVEDAFHDDRCDVLALLALRNQDAIATTVASTAQLDLTA
jgi:L-asparagine oxygenase